MRVKIWSWSKSVARFVAITIVMGALAIPAPALAKGGAVYPADETVKDWTLAEAAAATAYFNTGSRAANTLPANFPFQILYITPDGSNTFSVKSGTKFYVPVVYDDSSSPYPFDVTNAAAVSAYYFDRQQLGADYIRITVDNVATDLGPAYPAGAVTPNLPDGANYYTVVAAFLQPLSAGTHHISISARFSGAYIGGVVEFPPVTYTVIVH